MPPKINMAAFRHPKRTGAMVDPTPDQGRRLTGGVESKWAVKLKFKLKPNEGAKLGSGFYFNVPGANLDVILTAAHNLVNDNGQLVTDLEIHGQAIYENKTGNQLEKREQVRKFPAVQDGNHFLRLCADFDPTKQKKSAGADWGAIFLPKTDVTGFGFDLKFAFQEHLQGNVYVSGYEASTAEVKLVNSDGPIIITLNDQLKYRAVTAQGISGSVVWQVLDGQPIALGIQ